MSHTSRIAYLKASAPHERMELILVFITTDCTHVIMNSRPEGSISKGYGTEEVIEFCVDLIPDLKPVGVPESRYEGRLSGKGTLGKKAKIFQDGHSLTQAHYTV